MDSVNVDKIQALKKYKQQEFMNSLKFYPLVAFTCCIVFTSPIWLTSLLSCCKNFFFVSIPQIFSFFFSAKSLFILGNLIVVFLLKDSKAREASPSSSSQKTHAVQGIPAVTVETRAEVVAIKKTGRVEIVEYQKNETEEQQEEDEFIIPDLSTEELKIRADCFIAMVNKQIRLEVDDELICR